MAYQLVDKKILRVWTYSGHSVTYHGELFINSMGEVGLNITEDWSELKGKKYKEDDVDYPGLIIGKAEQVCRGKGLTLTKILCQ